MSLSATTSVRLPTALPALIPEISSRGPEYIQWQNQKKGTPNGRLAIIKRALGGNEGLMRMPSSFGWGRLSKEDPRFDHLITIIRPQANQIREYVEKCCKKHNITTYDKKKIRSLRLEEAFTICINNKFAEHNASDSHCLSRISPSEDKTGWSKALLKLEIEDAANYADDEVKGSTLIDSNSVNDEVLNLFTEYVYRRWRGEQVFKILNTISQLGKDLPNTILEYTYPWFKGFEAMRTAEELSIIKFQASENYLSIAANYLNEERNNIIVSRFLKIFIETERNLGGKFIRTCRLIIGYAGDIRNDTGFLPPSQMRSQQSTTTP